MSGTVESALTFLIVFLSPAIPAVIVFYLIKPENIVANAEGTLFGISIKAGGGFASYVILCLLAAFIYDQVGGHRIIPATVKFIVSVEGEKRVLNSFFQDDVRRLTFYAKVGNKVERLSIGDIDLDKGLFTTTNFTVDQRFIGSDVELTLSRNLAGFYLQRKAVLLQGETPVLAKYEPESNDLAIPLHLTEKVYLSKSLEYRIRYIRVASNVGDKKVEVIDFGPDSQGRMYTYRIWAKRLPTPEVAVLTNRWSSDAVANLELKQFSERFQETFTQAQTLGTEIGYQDYVTPSTESGLAITPSVNRGEGQGLRVIFGPTPRIEGLRNGLQKNESIILLAEITGGPVTPLTSIPTQQRYEGTRPKLYSERVLLMVTTEGDLKFSTVVLPFEFVHWSGSTEEFGNPIKHSDERHKILYISNIEPLSRVAVPVLFSPN